MNKPCKHAENLIRHSLENFEKELLKSYEYSIFMHHESRELWYKQSSWNLPSCWQFKPRPTVQMLCASNLSKVKGKKGSSSLYYTNRNKAVRPIGTNKKRWPSHSVNENKYKIGSIGLQFCDRLRYWLLSHSKHYFYMKKTYHYRDSSQD